MSSAEADGSAFINTMIGHGSTVRGEMAVQGFVRIDGDLHGSLSTEGRVLVSPTGRVKGRLTGKQLVVGGVVKGDLYAAEQIVLLASALVIGNVYAPRATIEKGAVVEGYCYFAPRIREEGVLHHQVQKAYTLSFDRSFSSPSAPVSHG